MKSMGRRMRALTALGAALTLGGAGLAQGQGMMQKGPKHGCMMMMEGHGMGMGMDCPMMSEDFDLKVEKTEDGATIRITSSDSKMVSVIQKHAEIMRLIHELHRIEME